MSGSANNLPARVTIEGVDQVTRELRNLAAEYATTSRAAEQMAPSFNRGVDALTALERRTGAAGRAVSDLRGAMELLGASGIAGPLGQVASTLGNVGDALSTAGVAAGAFGNGLRALLPFIAPIAAGAAAVALATTDWNAAADRLRTTLHGLRGVTYDNEVATAAYNRGMEGLVTTLLSVEAAERRVAQASRERQAQQLNEQADRIRPQLAAARARLGELQPTANQVALARQVAGPDTALPAAVQRRMSEFQSVQADVQRMAAQLAALEGGVQDLQAVPFLSPSVPRFSENPAAGRAGGGGGGRASAAAREPAMLGDNMVADFWRHQQQQERAREAQMDGEIRRIEAVERRSVEAFARIGEAAIERIGGALVQSFIGGERAAVNFRGVATAALASAGTDLVGLGVVNPALNAVMGGSRPTLGSALGSGGLGQMFGGVQSGLGGFLNTPLWGGNVQGPAFNGIAASGAPTIGGALGAVGGGFALGSLLGGFTAGDSPARQTNAMIGAGVGSAGGAAAGMAIGAVGGPIGMLAGALIGGALGGAGGGLIGPGAPNEGFNVQIQANGGFGISDARERGRGREVTQAVLQAEQEIAQANALLSALGVRASGGSALGEDPQNPRVPRSFAQTIPDFRFSAQNANLNRALSVRGSLSGLGELQDIAGFVQLYESIVAVREPVTAFQAQIDAINRQFDGLTARARDLGLAEEGLNAARARSIAEVEQARRDEEAAAERARRNQAAASVTGGVTGLTDFIRGLRTSPDNPLNPQARLAAARTDFATLASSPGAANLNRLRGSAEAFLAASRDVNGTGRGFANDFQATLDALERFSTVGTDQLTASAAADIQRSATEILQAELVALRAEVVGLRREVQQGAANPLTARAA